MTVRFVSPPSASDVAQLEALGAEVAKRRDGSPRGGSRFVMADVPESALAAIAALPRVERIAPDGSPFPAPPPLDYTAGLVQAPAVWAQTSNDGVPLTGRGMTVCDIDSGIDIFHPLFFRADGGYYDWVDVDGDGVFRPGIDGVDLDGSSDAKVLRVVDAVLRNAYGKVLDHTDDPGLLVGWDFLYADVDGSQEREFGPKAGFTEADAAYGEPLFAVDDVDKNGVLDVGERIVRLKTSKVKALKSKKIYRRGQNLIDAPVTEDAFHGTGASSILVAGNIGLNRLVGLAPDADLVFAGTQQFSPTSLTDFCIDEGARVVLHEYAPWYGYHLDGSSDLEELIDETVPKGVVHINPAGNLSGADKMCKRPIVAGQETIVPIEAPKNSYYAPFHFLGVSLLWRDASRELTIALEDPTGFSKTFSPSISSASVDWHDGLAAWVERDVSNRGTVLVHIYVSHKGQTPKVIPTGTWKLHVIDPTPAGAPDLTLIGSVADDTSGWDKGIHFPEFPTEDHLIGFPGTADHGLVVGAYTGHGASGGTPGKRAFYSGRGHRIDGKKIMSMSAPDDPITGGWSPKEAGSYMEFGGTSGASPHVAGAATLLLQARPDLDGSGVKNALQNSALADEFVGKAPNEDYGYGKLQTYNAIFGEPPPKGGAPTVQVARTTVIVGEMQRVAVEVKDTEDAFDALDVELDRNYDGVNDERLSGPFFEVKFDEVGTYVARLGVTDRAGQRAAALAFVDVVEPPAEGPHNATERRAQEDGCSIGAGADASGSRAGAWALTVAVAALGFGARRRRRP